MATRPGKERMHLRKNSHLLWGKKDNFWWDLPHLIVMNFKHIYEIPNEKYKKNLKFLTELLQIEDIIEVQTRKLSLGQKNESRTCRRTHSQSRNIIFR